MHPRALCVAAAMAAVSACAPSLAAVSVATRITPQVSFTGTLHAGYAVPLHGRVFDGFHFHQSAGSADVLLGLGSLGRLGDDVDDEAALTRLDSSGIIEMDIELPELAQSFGFGFGMLLSPYTRAGTYVPLLSGLASITAYAGDVALGTLSYDAHALPDELYHGYAGLHSDLPFDRVHIRASNTGYQMNPGGRPMVAVDNFGIVPVPEPAPAALAAAGAGLLRLLWRRRGRDGPRAVRRRCPGPPRRVPAQAGLVRAALAALAALLPAAAPAAVVYAVRSFDAGPNLYLQGINVSGQIIGHTNAGPTSANQAFVWTDGTLRQIGLAGTGYSNTPTGINDAGTVVGDTFVGNAQVGPFVYSDGQSTVLPGLQRTVAIDSAGQVLGVNLTNNVPHTVILRGNATTDIGAMPGSNGGVTYGTDFNDRGDVVGWGIFGPVGSQHPFLYRGGVITDILPPGGLWASASRVNDAGQVAGYGCGTVSGTCGGWIHDAGQYRMAGALLGLQTNDVRVWDLNDRGQFVASVTNGVNAPTEFYLYDGTQAIFLNAALAGGDGWTLTAVDGLNDAGQIAARGRIGNGPVLGLLLTPVAVPEPAAALLALVGMLGVRCAVRAGRLAGGRMHGVRQALPSRHTERKMPSLRTTGGGALWLAGCSDGASPQSWQLRWRCKAAGVAVRMSAMRKRRPHRPRRIRPSPATR